MKLDKGLTSEEDQIERIYKGECNTLDELLKIIEDYDNEGIEG
jgi:hypothetical protein